jgi:peptide/nickel transport system ATP-binding protein
VTAVLRVERLSVWYAVADGERQAVHDVSLALRAGTITGVAGESGCGKSTVALAATGFRPPGLARRTGRAVLGDVDLLTLPVRGLRELWGRRVAFVPQDAGTSLTPSRRVGGQFAEVLRRHERLGGGAARTRAAALLAEVDVPDPEDALRRFPFQFSGGQQQRIALALALAARPAVLILDEPTTGLDVTTQARIVALIARLVRETGVAAMYVSHDLPLVRETCDETVVMYAGEVVERAPSATLWRRPRHPYTTALIAAAPSVAGSRIPMGIPGRPPPGVMTSGCSFAARCRHREDECAQAPVELRALPDGHEVRCRRAHELTLRPLTASGAPEASRARGGTLLTADRVSCRYGRGRLVVNDVSVDVHDGEILALVGESGSGKSTLLRAIAGLHPRSSGAVRLDGTPLAPRVPDRTPEQRRALQLVYQNPASSLNPRQTVHKIVERPLATFFPELSAADRRDRVRALLDAVQLDPSVLDAFPSHLSGGQQQRVALARALAAEPRALLCDEVVSALDVSVQATVLDVLRRLRRDLGVAVLFVTHDLAVVRTFADRVAVMRDGRVLEMSATPALFSAPVTDYARDLLAAASRGAAPA